MADNKMIIALDIDYPSGTEVKSEGTTYFRLTKEFKEFLDLVQEKHKIIGFEYEPGEWNFGIILGKKEIKIDILKPVNK